MNKRIIQSSLIAAALLISGCATMSGDECMTSDWRAIGFEDGSRGYAASRISSHRKACAKHGVTPDLQAYQEGRNEGLYQYCRPSNGFNVGANGGSYNGVCADHNEFQFIDAFNTGRQLYTLRSRVNNADFQISAKTHELEENAERIRVKEAALIAEETTVQDRVLILADLKDLSEENGQLEAEIDQLIADRAYHEAELAAFEAMLSDSGY